MTTDPHLTQHLITSVQLACDGVPDPCPQPATWTLTWVHIDDHDSVCTVALACPAHHRQELRAERTRPAVICRDHQAWIVPRWERIAKGAHR